MKLVGNLWYSVMEELEAQQIITAHAACAIVGGCDLCPLWNAERERTVQRGICQEAITAEKVKEALVTLRGSLG